jgi:hypothetical protein
MTTRRDRLRLIRADLRARLDAGEFGDQLYTCALGHEWLLWLYVGTLLGLAGQFERWTDAEKADHAAALAYVAGELERISEAV